MKKNRPKSSTINFTLVPGPCFDLWQRLLEGRGMALKLGLDSVQKKLWAAAIELAEYSARKGLV